MTVEQIYTVFNILLEVKLTLEIWLLSDDSENSQFFFSYDMRQINHGKRKPVFYNILLNLVLDVDNSI